MKDLELDNYFDLQVSNGDFKIDDVRQQDILLICKAQKGHFYQHPKLGVGLETLLNSNFIRNSINKEIRENLIQDNFKIKEINISGVVGDYNVYIDAE